MTRKSQDITFVFIRRFVSSFAFKFPLRVLGAERKTGGWTRCVQVDFRESGVNEEGNCAVWTFCIDTGKRDEKKRYIYIYRERKRQNPLIKFYI